MAELKENLLHRFSSVLDMHYDIASLERKNSTNAIVTTYWQYKKMLSQQLRDDLCNDIESKLHPSPKSGVKPRTMPELVDSDDDDDSGGPHGDESLPLTTTLGACQSSAKSEPLATKVVSSFQLDSTAPGQERSVTALVTGVRRLTADTTAASASMYTKSPGRASVEEVNIL
jgi:hypothetical protein